MLIIVPNFEQSEDQARETGDNPRRAEDSEYHHQAHSPCYLGFDLIEEKVWIAVEKVLKTVIFGD